MRFQALIVAALVGCGGAASRPETPRAPVAVAPSPADTRPDCPTTRPNLDLPLDKAGYEGLPIGHVCMLGGGEGVAELVRGVIRTREKAPFEAARVTRDIHAIFELGVVEDVEVLVMPSSPTRPSAAQELTVLYVMKVRPLVESVTFGGATAFGNDRLAQLFPIKTGQVIDPSVVKAAIDGLVSEYAERGYGHARATVTSDTQNDGRVALAVHVTEGPLLVVRTVDVVGVKQGKREDVLHAMRTHVGDPYLPAVYERDALMATAYFYDHGMLDVKIDPKIVEDGDRVDVALNVSEGPVYRIEKLSYEGVPLGLGKDPVALLRAKPKDVFNRSVLRADIEGLTSRAKAQGTSVDIEPFTELDPKKRTVKLVLRGVAH